MRNSDVNCKKKKRTLVFVWDNYGPTHVDRARAIIEKFGEERPIELIQYYEQLNDSYGWTPPHSVGDADVTTVFSQWTRRPFFMVAFFLLMSVAQPFSRKYYFIHRYELPHVFLFSLLLRLTGNKLFMLNDSKFDDKPRHVWREAGKSFFLLPYHGALSNGTRSKSYWKYLGLQNVHGEYNTVSLDRIRHQAGAPPAPNGTPFGDRHFTCVARLIPEKNLPVLLQAYRLYCDQVDAPRPLHLCGSGPLEADLRRQVEDLDLTERVVFRGWLQEAEVSRALANTLAMILPSVSETFGNVVIEAQAMGLPVIVSDNVGARDLVVKSGVNGFVVEPDNPRGMAFFMAQLSEDEALWRRMCTEALATAPLGDVQRFVEGVEALITS